MITLYSFMVRFEPKHEPNQLLAISYKQLTAYGCWLMAYPYDSVYNIF